MKRKMLLKAGGIMLTALCFIMSSCSNGASGSDFVDKLTADGDYYNDTSTGSDVINVNLGGSGLGWVSNAPSSSSGSGGVTGVNGITNSSLTPEQVVTVNTARNLASQGTESNYNSALIMLEKVLKQDPNAAEAAELYNAIRRYKELAGIGQKSLISLKEEELAKIEKEIAALETKIETQKMTVQQALEAMNAACDEYNSLSGKYQSKLSEIESKGQEINDIKKDLADLQGKLDNETDPAKKAVLQKQYDDMNSKYKGLLNEYQALQDELSLMEKQLKAAKDRYDVAKKNYEEQLKILEEYIASYNAKCTLRDELIQLIKDLKAERDTLFNYLKNIDYTSTGLGDYTYSMRWIVDADTAPYTAYKDITRFIYERWEKGYGEDCTYAIVGTVNGKVYDENNYITMSIEYDKNYETRTSRSPYYGEYYKGNAVLIRSIETYETQSWGTDHNQMHYVSSDYWVDGSECQAAYYDNTGNVRPDAVVSSSAACYSSYHYSSSDGNIGNGKSSTTTGSVLWVGSVRLPYSYDVINGFKFTGITPGEVWDSYSSNDKLRNSISTLYSVTDQYSATYTNANIKIRFCDQNGSEIPDLQEYQYVEHAQLTFSGKAGSPFEVYKARCTSAHLRDEAKAKPFPVMDVTLFARADQVKGSQQ